MEQQGRSRELERRRMGFEKRCRRGGLGQPGRDNRWVSSSSADPRLRLTS